jgi:hypothetical protein
MDFAGGMSANDAAKKKASSGIDAPISFKKEEKKMDKKQ